jgi:hypothetical protein
MPYPDTRAHAETMLFRCPGRHEWEGIAHDCIVVPDAEIDARLAEGWHRTVHEAAGAQIKANEAEQAKIAKTLQAAGAAEATGGVIGAASMAPKLRAVHKGHGMWAVEDEAGKVVRAGLSKSEAAALAA